MLKSPSYPNNDRAFVGISVLIQIIPVYCAFLFSLSLSALTSQLPPAGKAPAQLLKQPCSFSPFWSRKHLVVSSRLAVVSDQLETTNHLANGEETKTLGQYNATSGKAGCAEGSRRLDAGSNTLEERAASDGSPQVLVESLEDVRGAGYIF